jgi:aminoglycoside phosphotransferase family enzyme/predicted kinase
LTPGKDKGAFPDVRVLLDPGCFPHPVGRVELIETHISWVILAGDYAYKLKKPVDLGFLDFSTLERRAHFCAEELRINRRLAPDLYLDVVTLRRDGEQFRFDGEGRVVEYAVRMRRFPQDQQLDRCLERGELGEPDIDEIAELIGGFHESAPRAPVDSDWGTPAAVAAPARENFSQLEPALGPGFSGETVDRLERWTEIQFPRLAPAFSSRREHGRVRECHGDLHLRNMARVNGRIVAFDGIEFDPALRWIDVISDSAFLIMDLESRGEKALAWRFLNRWLHVTGDFDGLGLLPWYLVYRHMVRAKVDAIRLNQGGVDRQETSRLSDRIERHFAMALEATDPGAPVLLVTCGVSGSGKSWLAERLAQRLPAVWVRSDVERKRLFGMAPTQRPPADRTAEIYGAEASRRTYARLAELAGGILQAGYSVIADATYLRRADRDHLLAVAGDHGIPGLILACEAPEETLRARVSRRQTADRDASDAGIAVLESQLRKRQPFASAEPLARVITDETLNLEQVLATIRSVGNAPRP